MKLSVRELEAALKYRSALIKRECAEVTAMVEAAKEKLLASRKLKTGDAK
jgi:hypothetical protein